MSLENAIRTRRTVSSFKPTQISDQEIQKALELALLAPNHKHTFPWKFIRVGPQAKLVIANQAVEASLAKGLNLNAEQKTELVERFTNPTMLAFVQKISGTAFQQEEDYATVVCSLHSVMLYFADKGFLSKWSTAGLSTSERTYNALGVQSAQERVIGLLMIGEANQALGPQRRPVLDHLFIKVE